MSKLKVHECREVIEKAFLEIPQFHELGLGYVGYILVLAMINVTVQQLMQFQGVYKEHPSAVMDWNKIKVLGPIGQTQTIIFIFKIVHHMIHFTPLISCTKINGQQNLPLYPKTLTCPRFHNCIFKLCFQSVCNLYHSTKYFFLSFFLKFFFKARLLY